MAAEGVMTTSSGLPDCDSKTIGFAADIPDIAGRINRSANVCELSRNVTGPLIPFAFMASIAAPMLVKLKAPVPIV